MKKSSIFLLSMHKVAMSQCLLMLLFKTCYSKSKYHNLHNVQLTFVSVQRTAQTSFRIFLHTRIIVDDANSTVMKISAILRSRFLKAATERIKSYIFETELRMQGRLSMQSLHRYKLLMVSKSWDEVEVVQCPFKIISKIYSL